MPLPTPVLLIPWLLLFGSCSTPPRPPTVDESQKRPVNSANAIELQTCKSDLQATRLRAVEELRVAETASAQRQQHLAKQHAEALARTQAKTPAANGIFTAHFDFGSTKAAIPAEMAASLIDEARAAPLIVLKGRTDGASDEAGESRIARRRADAVREVLVAAGIDPARIRTTYQPAGDHAADNTSRAGRALNRRVEIEVYRAEPVNLAPTTSASRTD